MMRGVALFGRAGGRSMRGGFGPPLRGRGAPRGRIPPPPRRTNIQFRPNIFIDINLQPQSSNDNNCDELPSEKDLRRAFEKFDSDKDGKINQNEFKSALRDLDPEISDSEIAKAFQALDSDGDGFVVFKEFVRLFKVAPTAPAEPKPSGPETAFGLLNAFAGGGFIGTSVELCQVIKRPGQG